LPNNYKYRAFISYSHSDEKWAAWLHKALETYRVPKHIVGEPTEFGPVPSRIAPIFRDREELPTATNLGDTLTQALADSACQIVICSPRAAKSRWTNEEILTFTRLGRSDRIYCLIVDGEPGASEKAETADDECFPPALTYEMGADGELTDHRSEPIAADARKGKDNKNNAKLKLIAGMLGVGFDELRQREHQRKQRRMVALTAAAVVGMTITSGLAVTAYVARIEAEEQRNRAQIEAETARQTTQFMVGLFEVSDPSEALGNTITARAILDRGVERIDTELASQPQIQATLKDTMGTVYTSLALYNDAVDLLESALDTRKRLIGAEDPDIASSLNHLGEVLGFRGDFAEAQALFEQALDVQESAGSGESLEAAVSFAGIGEMLAAQGEFDAAEPHYIHTLEIRRKLLPERHPDIATSLQALGINYYETGEAELAVKYLRDAVAMQRGLHESTHPDLASALNDLGFAVADMGDFVEAEELFRETLSIWQHVLGKVHPDVALGLNQVAWAVQERGELDQAEALYREAIQVQLSIDGGASHPKLARYLGNLSFLLYQKGQTDEATSVGQEALELRRRILGDRHPEVADGAAMLAYWSIQQGQYVTAESLLDESLAIRRESLGESHPKVASALILKAGIQVETGRFEEGRKTAGAARTILEESLPPDHWRIAAAVNVEGAALAGLGRYEGAEQLLLRSDEILAEAPMPGVAEQSRQRLTTLYELWGKDEKATQISSSEP
jgi:tetratricopeptide (TPR) repeat protein